MSQRHSRRDVIESGLLATGALLLPRTPRASARAQEYVPLQRGDLAAYVGELRDRLPGLDSGLFVPPREAELTQLLFGFAAALSGDSTNSSGLLGPLGYEVATFEHLPTGRHFLVIREAEPRQRYWGTFVFNEAASAADVVIQAPHPVWDALTPELAIAAYLRLDARWFALAGCHRYANGQVRGSVSDMAHNGRTLFQRVHEKFTGPETRVIQYHGFSVSSHPGYPNVVLSDGTPHPHEQLLRLRQAIEDHGESAGTYDGVSWSALAASTNVQGRHTRAIGGRFFHLEHRYGLRADPVRRAAMVEALAATLGA